MATRRHQSHDKHTRNDHDKDDRHRKPKRKRKPHQKPPSGGPATEKIKAQSSSVVTGQDPAAGTPQDYPNDDAAFSTGPGQAVEYHYHRVGTYADDYAAQANLQQFETQERAPNIGGPGEIVTSGAANNPT